MRGLMPGALLLLASPLGAQPSEEAVKAAFLPKFLRYVDWPAGAGPATGAPYWLCLIGGDPFGGMLDQAAAREIVDGHPVQVRRVAGPDGVNGCHIAFVGGVAERAGWIDALDHVPVLTVTDSRSGDRRGIIHFVLSNGRVRFLIDNATAAARGLTINARLLALAISVRQRP